MDHYVDPTRAAFDVFKSLPRDTPVAMLNFVRLRDVAAYPPDTPEAGSHISGAEAYRQYGQDSAPVFSRVGGTITWRGRMECMLIGPTEERWDVAFIAAYPNAGAFLAMVTDKDYQKAVRHRQAAVETSRLMRCAPSEGGDSFG